MAAISMVTFSGIEDVRRLSPTRIIEGPGESPGLDGIGKRVKQDAPCL